MSEAYYNHVRMHKVFLWGSVGVVGLLVAVALVWYVNTPSSRTILGLARSVTDNEFSRQYSRGKCQGTKTVPFTHSPMQMADIGQIEPYGLMIDAHVIPTSHGYISPKVFHSPRDAYGVYAIADGTIVNVSHRGDFIGDNKPNKKTDEYQMYFEYSCTFYSYYDLLTSLAPDIAAQVGTLSGFEQRPVRIPVKAGQLVGRVGGQTVDFAVWNFDQPPAFFANPASYAGDENRFYLEDMFKHFTEPLRTQLLAKNVRTAEPRTGKVAYDKAGRLVGNWFRPGSGGFNGPPGARAPGTRYWDGHVTIAYDYITPSEIKVSLGNFGGRSAQFAVIGNRPDPAMVSRASGLVKYGLIATQQGSPGGTLLVQMLSDTTLKVEAFPGKAASDVAGFTAKAQMYER